MSAEAIQKTLLSTNVVTVCCVCYMVSPFLPMGVQRENGVTICCVWQVVTAFLPMGVQRENGVTVCYVWQVVSAFLPMGVQRAVSQSRRSSKDDHGPTKLQYQHIEGSLYLLYLGLATSAVAFIGELLYNKYRPGTSPSR
jgi:hypothetical protein